MHIHRTLLATILLMATSCTSNAVEQTVSVASPDRRNVIELTVKDGNMSYTVSRDGHPVIGTSTIAPRLAEGQLQGSKLTIGKIVSRGTNTEFPLPWGKTNRVVDRSSGMVVNLSNGDLRWQIELRAYDDGVAFRYRLPEQETPKEFVLLDEATEFNVAGNPTTLSNALEGFTTSHESVYERQPLSELPAEQLFDCPMLFVWPEGPAAAITEARVRNFAGMYMQRASADATTLQCRLSPLPSQPEAVVKGPAPHVSPWRVILLADKAGELIESNLLLCLNDPPTSEFAWARPGKSTFHWWYGNFEDDYLLPAAELKKTYVARHKQYIDFCAENNIAYHALSGDGRAWYEQSSEDYAVASDDADVRKARPELGLPEIFAYAQERGVGMRLWVHWQALSKHLDEAMALYQEWGVKGLMVDFLDRDDQEMLEWVDRMLESAARHQIHIQIHGSSKYSGEQRTFPNLFNREGVLNLEYVKWSKFCTPQHSVNVAYTRALAGPVDFHLGGFRSVPRAQFEPRDRAPVVMGTRCHNLALYVVYENPMPMVADAPSAYAGQTGFEFIQQVPTTWDETRFVTGEPGEFFVVARRSGDTWYLAGITNWTAREVHVPTDFLGAGKYEAQLWIDGSMEASKPNAIDVKEQHVDATSQLKLKLATGGGFVAVLRGN